MEKSIKTEDKQAPPPPSQGVEKELPAEKPHRTLGLKVFDILLYPLFTNIGVFSMSVVATYLTTRGGDRNALGKLKYGKVGEFFQKRGEWMTNQFKSMGMNHGQADMSKMVVFSFLDGSILAPFVKLFEDRREKIAHYLDDKFGTEPADLSVYKAEPRQSWFSVIAGRFAVAAVVVPTAVALDKTGLNDTLFSKPGEKTGEWLEKQPGIKKWFGQHDVKELSRVSFFEAFYTSVCTAGLYVTSRALARMGGDKLEKDEPAKPTLPTASAPASSDAKDSFVVEAEDKKAHANLKRPHITHHHPTISHTEKYTAEQPGTMALGI